MANKTLFWLKLHKDFFGQKHIKKLRKMAGGDTFTIIYLKMQLLSLENDGNLLFDGVEETFEEELALELDEEVDNVKMTILYLRSQGLIEIVQSDEFSLTEVKQNILSESQSAQRVRRHRAKQKALQCNTEVTDCNKNVATELELELEIEKDIDITPLTPLGETPVEKKPKDKNADEKKQTMSKAFVKEQLCKLDNHPNLKEKIREWLEYKDERMQKYKPKGLQGLISQAINSARDYGEAATMEAVDYAIANNYQGILWDYARKKGAPNERHKPNPATQRPSQESRLYGANASPPTLGTVL